MWRVVVSVGVLMIGCSKKEEKAAPPPPPVVAIDAAIPALDAAAIIDAKPPEDPRVRRVQRYINGYLDLLWIDLQLANMLAAYPGSPPTNRYSSGSYSWDLPDRKAIEMLLRHADYLAASPIDNEASDADRAVAAYTTGVLAVWPKLNALAQYYAEKRFVDDEFAKGREEGPLVAKAIAAMAPLRKPMTDAVFEGWRAVSIDMAGSPRAVINDAFEACMRTVSVILEHPVGKREASVEKRIDDTMSACRRSIGAVSALPSPYSSFAEPLRKAAIRFGDSSGDNFWRKYAIDDAQELIRGFTKRWPDLPSAVAEKVE